MWTRLVPAQRIKSWLRVNVTGVFGVLSVFGRRIKGMIRLRPEQMWTCNVTCVPTLRRRSANARLLELRVWIPPAAWMSVSCGCCVLSGRGLCVGLITRPEESYRVWVTECNQAHLQWGSEEVRLRKKDERIKAPPSVTCSGCQTAKWRVQGFRLQNDVFRVSDCKTLSFYYLPWSLKSLQEWTVITVISSLTFINSLILLFTWGKDELSGIRHAIKVTVKAKWRISWTQVAT
jgi:hypothetical protein